MSERRVLTRTLRRLPDETEIYVPTDDTQKAGLIDPAAYPALAQDTAIDSFIAMQLGLWQIFSSMTMYSIDVMALLAGRKEAREFQFERVIFDFARMEDDRQPHNTVTFMQQGPTRYSSPGRETKLLEDTVDKYCEGSVLKVMHSAEVTLSAVIWLGNKDDRGGVRRAIESSFDEPLDERAGRRVVIPEYYYQTARYTLQEIDYPDDGESARDNTWPLVARFQSDIDVVKLVPAPGYLRRAVTNIHIEPPDGTPPTPDGNA